MLAYVVYMYKTSEEIGMGSCGVEFKHDPPTLQDVREIADMIKSYKEDIVDVTVINWKRLSEED